MAGKKREKIIFYKRKNIGRKKWRGKKREIIFYKRKIIASKKWPEINARKKFSINARISGGKNGGEKSVKSFCIKCKNIARKKLPKKARNNFL